ncbi:bactofilin family protein [Paenibacillus physcomitrellae]|uniref:Membrane protein n=1 Tax=Paenibacillus physcomitrellae TaxID=1619311 RepID=A0ABQ1FT92_9BACL|nr:polymer-forming cytoskeletal protein [Paenibacillus physcomitrellae]GGA27520.1 membrane protein [Paenibacillus physcomitrellae]
MKMSKSGKNTYTLIGQGSDIEGVLRSQSGVRIEGTFRGEIETSGEVFIGASGEAHSSIKGSSIVVAGKVFGDVVTEGRLTLLENGHIVGNIDARSLVISEGGRLNGETRMDQPAAEGRTAFGKKALQSEAETV